MSKDEVKMQPTYPGGNHTLFNHHPTRERPKHWINWQIQQTTRLCWMIFRDWKYYIANWMYSHHTAQTTPMWYVSITSLKMVYMGGAPLLFPFNFRRRSYDILMFSCVRPLIVWVWVFWPIPLGVSGCKMFRGLLSLSGALPCWSLFYIFFTTNIEHFVLIH